VGMIVPRSWSLSWATIFGSLLLVCSHSAGHAQAQPPSQAKSPVSTARPVGTVKAINGNTVTVSTDSGSEITVLLQPSTRVLRMAPGQKDLKDAAPMPVTELQPGDRMIIRGNPADDGKSVVASSLLVMRKTDIQERQEHEREDWQKRGVGGLVRGIDTAAGTIALSTAASGSIKTITIHTSKETIVRRYASESVKFQDAKPGTLDQIKAGDQLRARGSLMPDGNELSAEEIVSGSFRNIAGTLAAVDPADSTVSVMDLFTKKTVAVKITADSQLRKLPPMLAQRIAVRLKGSATESGAVNAASNALASPKGNQTPGESSGPHRGGDLQQVLGRLPAVTLADLQKGEAVMLVTMPGGADSPLRAITLLTGVEPILTASPTGEGAAMLLSPWALGSTAGEAAAQ